MNRRGLLIASFVLITGLVSYHVYHLGDKDYHLKSHQTYKKYLTEEDVDIESVVAYATGTPDNPYARVDFDNIRLRDPKTLRIPQQMRRRELAYARTASERVSLSARQRAIDVSFSGRGPANLGGRTRALALDRTDPSGNTILAGGVSGGMFYSADGGQSWTRTTRSDQFPSVSCIVQDPRPGRGNIWYYGTGEITGNSADGNGGAFYRGDGIYQSSNGGASWELIPTTSSGDITQNTNPFRYVNSIVIDPTNLNQNEMYAAVIDGIIRTTDAFVTYEFVLGTPNNTSLFTDVAITTTGRLYATISDDSGNNQDIGIWTSEDGINWEPITTPIRVPSSGFQRTVIGISPSNENIVYFLRTDGNGQTYRLFRYDATTDILEDRSANIPALGGRLGDYDSQNSYNQVIRVHPANSDIVFIGGTNLYRSTNGFSDDTETSWVGGYSFFSNRRGQVNPYFNHHPDQHALVFYPNNPNRMLSSHDGGISITNNNLATDTTRVNDQNQERVDEVTVRWTSLNNNYLTTQFYGIDIEKFNVGDNLIAGGMQDNSSYAVFDSDPKAEWVELFGGDGGYTAVTYNSIVVSAQFAQMVRYAFSDDDGSFEGAELISPPGAGEQPFLFVNPIIADPVAPNKMFVAGREEIFYTRDIRENPEGNDWLVIDDSVFQNAGNFSALAASTTPANILYGGTSRGRLFKISDTNRPDEIEEITGANFPTNGYINNVAVDPRDADKVLVVFSNYNIQSAFYSENGGRSWVTIGGNLEENADGSGNGPSLRWIEVIPNGVENIYVLGTSIGLYSTENLDGMRTEWVQIGEEAIGNTVIEMVKVRPIDGTIIVATHGKGVFEGRMDLALQPHIFITDFPCNDAEITAIGNQTLFTETHRFSYQWLRNGQEIRALNGPAIVTDGTAGRIQLRLTNEVTGEIALSNEIDIQYIYGDLCGGELIVTSDEPLIEPEALTFSVYPNPVVDVVNLQPGNAFSSRLNVQMYDLQGKVLYQENLINRATIEIDVSKISSGYFFLRVSDGEKEEVVRLQKR